MDLVGAILAGGRSRRMGRDKAAVEVAGRPLLAWVAEAVVAALGAAWVVGRERPAVWNLPGVHFLADAEPGRGPLGGLATALSLGRDVLLVGCDMPALTPQALAWLAGEAASRPAEAAVVGLRDGRPEPLFAVYRQSLRGEVERRIATGQLALRELLNAADAALVDVPPAFADQLQGANEPADLVHLETLLARG